MGDAKILNLMSMILMKPTQLENNRIGSNSVYQIGICKRKATGIMAFFDCRDLVLLLVLFKEEKERNILRCVVQNTGCFLNMHQIFGVWY